MKLLNVVFTYNRYHLTKNTVESLREFGPNGDLLIFDDGSTDPRLLAYFQQLREQGQWILTADGHDPSYHGGLYTNMNKAVDLAFEKNYSHIFFIQDDVQFMWKDLLFEQRVETIFRKRPDAAMVTPLFQKGIIASSLPQRMEPHEDAECWHLRPYGICDMGIMPTQLFKERDWRFEDSEGKNGQQWMDWGYKLYMPSAPIMAWVPWPFVKSAGSHWIGDHPPANKYFLKPLSAEQITTLAKAKTSAIPYHEDYCFPWGWRCLSPYWFTGLNRFTVREYAKWLWRDKRLPRMVSA